jgi:diguanylate cyclase (GGDEF)-like protein
VLAVRAGVLARLYRAVFFVLALAVLVLPGLGVSFALLDAWQLYVLPFAVLAVPMIARLAWTGHPEARTILAGAVVFAVMTLNDVATDRRLIATPRLAPVGFGMFVLSMAISLANRVTRLFTEVEDVNRTLERKVVERTEALQEANEQLARVARMDPLTQVANRRAFLERAGDEAARVRRTRRPFAIILGDIDHFKRFNDEHGHACGDAVLASAASLLREGAREHDLVARWGGEEFILLLPETDLEGAAALAERIRERVESSGHQHEGHVLRVTMTFGVSECGVDETLDDCVGRADRALYAGKTLGRNRVIADAAGTATPAL